MAVCQNLVPLVNIKIAGKWMFILLKMVLIGIDPYIYIYISLNYIPHDMPISQGEHHHHHGWPSWDLGQGSQAIWDGLEAQAQLGREVLGRNDVEHIIYLYIHMYIYIYINDISNHYTSYIIIPHLYIYMHIYIYIHMFMVVFVNV